MAVYGAASAGMADARDPSYLSRVLDRLPIDESWLFRDEGLWTWLKAELLPELVGNALGTGRPLRAVSLGCAGGQEATSLALLLQAQFAECGVQASGAASLSRVLGLDASPARVAQASSGLLSGWSVQRSRSEWLRGKVRLVDPVAGRWQVDEDVRALCSFEVGNLLDVAAPGSQALRGVDLVLCRHVLIYFSVAQAAEVVAGLAAALDPGAVLVLSPVEAHFADGLPGLRSLQPVGVFRAQAPISTAASRTADGASVASSSRPRQRSGQRSRPATGWAGGAPAPAKLGRISLRPAETAARLATAAVNHAAAGRRADALREARAACFHDTGHLFSRLVLGRELLEVDRHRGHAVLARLLELARSMPDDAEVPEAPGLSVAQLSTAAQLLLSHGGRE
jgi:chemotaxis protein methyltransferase CheR